MADTPPPILVAPPNGRLVKLSSMVVTSFGSAMIAAIVAWGAVKYEQGQVTEKLSNTTIELTRLVELITPVVAEFKSLQTQVDGVKSEMLLRTSDRYPAALAAKDFALRDQIHNELTHKLDRLETEIKSILVEHKELFQLRNKQKGE